MNLLPRLKHCRPAIWSLASIEKGKEVKEQRHQLLNEVSEVINILNDDLIKNNIETESTHRYN